MSAFDEVVEKLAKTNRQTATLLLQTVNEVDPDNEFRLEWARLCLNIAETGWHAWESTDAFIKLSPRITQLFGTDDLIRRGSFGLRLCGYSFEPGHSYFAGLQELIQHPEPDRLWLNLQFIESTGILVHQKYQQASNLLVAYFNAAFSVSQRNTLEEVSAWSDLAITLAKEKRANLLEFLQLSRHRVPWTTALDLQKVSVDAGLQFVAAYPKLEHKYGQGLIENQQSLFLSLAAGEHTLAPFFTALQSAALSIREARQLFSLLTEVRDARLATCLVERCQSLPLENLDAMRTWILVGLDQLRINFDAACAFFSLESVRSVELLEKIKGQVNFVDCKRVLRLYAEAISGRRIKVDAFPIAAGQQMEADYRELTRTDGLCIFLPDHVSRYSKATENFEFYKVALLHQLGYFEFDTFDRISLIERELAAYDDELLAHTLFAILEDARIDWRLETRFRGAAGSIRFQKQQALLGRNDKPFSRRVQMLEGLIRCGLDSNEVSFAHKSYHADMTRLCDSMQRLKCNTASPDDTLTAVAQCYEILQDHVVASNSHNKLTSQENETLPDELPAPVDFHGEMDVKQVALNLALVKLNEALKACPDEGMISLATLIDPENLDIEEIKKGDVTDALAMLLTELENRDKQVPADESDWSERLHDLELMLGDVSRQAREQEQFLYDEWDYVIDDYRRRWCTLFEIRDVEESPEFVAETLSVHAALLSRVRKQLNMLKPELLRKIKGVIDGDELDLDRTVESVVDRKTGITPRDNIYIQRQRKDRDVSALFLLDMSASTDDPIPDPNAGPASAAPDCEIGTEDDDLTDNYFVRDEPKTKRIIDLEKEAVILMAEALQELGDNYSVCGFSGYGRERVDYYLCKDFDEPYDQRARGRIGGIKPCRSTRMGPAIRHATRSLVKTESRIKALIIISDGYPQDFDYGTDRSSKDYGVRDTMKALGEARQQGVQAFCLTVDPSGHDYLREMCPDKQYMVIQDITQLPDELSKVYRSLTG